MDVMLLARVMAMAVGRLRRKLLKRRWRAFASGDHADAGEDGGDGGDCVCIAGELRDVWRALLSTAPVSRRMEPRRIE